MMSSNIDNIFADLSIFDNLTIFVMSFLKNGKSKDFLNWKWRVFWHHLLYYDAIIGSSRQNLGNAVNINVGIHITM